MRRSELFSKTIDLFLARGHEDIKDRVVCEQVGDCKVHVVGSKAGPIYVGLGQQYQAHPFSAVFVRDGIVVADVTPAGGVVRHGAEDDLIALLDSALGPGCQEFPA